MTLFLRANKFNDNMNDVNKIYVYSFEFISYIYDDELHMYFIICEL